MEPFNIKVNTEEKDITLTILPIEANSYKIIFDGGILGGINLSENSYQFIEPEDLEAGDLPIYEYKQGESREELLSLDKTILEEISKSIRKEV